MFAEQNGLISSYKHHWHFHIWSLTKLNEVNGGSQSWLRKHYAMAACAWRARGGTCIIGVVTRLCAQLHKLKQLSVDLRLALLPPHRPPSLTNGILSTSPSSGCDSPGWWDSSPAIAQGLSGHQPQNLKKGGCNHIVM